MISYWEKLSDREKKLLVVLGIIITVYLIYHVIVVNSMDRLEDVRAELIEIEDRERSLEIEIVRFERLQEEYKDYQIEDLLTRLPEEVDVAGVIIWLEDLFSDSRLSKPNIQFTEPDGESSYVQINLNFSGSYEAIYNVIRKIEDSKRAVSIESVELNGYKESISANMAMNFYCQSKGE